MSVDYDSMIVVGEYFPTVEAIIQHLIKQGVLTEGEFEDTYNGCRDTLCEQLFGDGFEIICANCWTGKGFYMGYESYDWKQYDYLIQEYKDRVGSDAVEVHSFVRVS